MRMTSFGGARTRTLGFLFGALVFGLASAAYAQAHAQVTATASSSSSASALRLPAGMTRVTQVEGITEYALANGLHVLTLPDSSNRVASGPSKPCA